MTQDELIAQIEARFASAEPANARLVSRELERLVRQLEDEGTRKRYEAAIDQLPDMVANLSDIRERGR